MKRRPQASVSGRNGVLPVTASSTKTSKKSNGGGFLWQRFARPVGLCLVTVLAMMEVADLFSKTFVSEKRTVESGTRPVVGDTKPQAPNVAAADTRPFAVTHENAVEVFRTFALDPPAPKKVPYSKDIDLKQTSFSQNQQDIEMDKLLNKKENGFFIEVGAYDGVSFSNSLFFELNRGWTGLLIEANPRAYRELLTKDRKAWSTPTCISMSSEVELGVTFLAHGMVGGYGVDRFQEGKSLSNAKKGDPYVYDVKANCFPLNVMLDAIGVDHVDMFSLDVEGAELSILKSIDWSRVTILSLVVEVNNAGAEINEFLKSKGYRRNGGKGGDNFFFHESFAP